jgi:hypothetical protein
MMVNKRHIAGAIGALLLVASPLAAQEPPAEPAAPEARTASIVMTDTAVLGTRRGLQAARYESTSRWIWGGFLGGFALGPIGAGLAWTLANNSDVALTVDQRLLLSYDGGSAFIEAYEAAYAQELLARRKRSALTGGAIGTAALAATLAAIWAVYYYY